VNTKGVAGKILRPEPTLVLLFVLFPLRAALGEISYDSAARVWKIASGPVEYLLQQKRGGVSFEYFGPRGAASWTPYDPKKLRHSEGTQSVRSDLAGQVEGQDIDSTTLDLISQRISPVKPEIDSLELVYQHRTLPLRIRAEYCAWSDTGIITRRLWLQNLGRSALHVQRIESLSWGLPAGEYDLTYLYGGWGQERQIANESLGAGTRRFVSTSGRSTNEYSPWLVLNNHPLGVRYLAQLAYSGNWEMNFERPPLTADQPYWQNELNVSLGMRFDYGGDLTLQSGRVFQLPEVAFTSSGLSLDDAANQLHRYQREFVVPRSSTNTPLLVQFNSWYPFPGKMSVSEMKQCAELAAKLGAEVYVLDAGWYNKKDWGTELGDYEADRQAFPNGIEELANYVRKLGMKFGIWVEIENVGMNSAVFRDHPDWCLQYNGKPIQRGARRQLDFEKPEVRQWARSVIDRLVHSYGLEWLKIDYNIEIGEQFDPPATAQREGDILYRHLMNYYSWLDELRAAYPRLVIENCASGGLRFDAGIMAHAHTTWLSDEVKPKPSVQLAYGCTLEFTPGVCNHWMVGDTDHGDVLPSDSPEWWDFIFRVPMSGEFGISSRVFTWNADLVRHAQQNISVYKHLRDIMVDADVFHLTPQPAHNDPTGWMALQYVPTDSARSVLMAYRLGESKGSEVFKLHRLKPDKKYRAESDLGNLGTWTGRELTDQGLRVTLDAPWRATVIRLQTLD
jgi:alpha-galactosidase